MLRLRKFNPLAHSRCVLRWLLPCAMLVACHRSPPPAPPLTVADLHFPVAVFFGDASVVSFQDADGLGNMSIGSLNAVTGPPPLVDSNFAIYRLAKLGSTHNGLWLMANPTGSTPVHFELERAPESGIENARPHFLRYLDSQTWRTDLEEKRRELAGERTLSGMVRIVNERSR